MKFFKHKIVTGITTEHEHNPDNPKYFAKFVNDNLICLGNTENEAIEKLNALYKEYKAKNKLHSSNSEQVLNTNVSTEKFEKYYQLGISVDFFERINEDPHTQIDDESTVKDLELSSDQIELINSIYNLKIKEEDIVVTIFEQIENSI